MLISSVEISSKVILKLFRRATEVLRLTEGLFCRGMRILVCLMERSFRQVVSCVHVPDLRHAAK